MNLWLAKNESYSFWVAALTNIKNGINYLPKKDKLSGKSVAIIGTGPAGLSCAYYLLTHGHNCTLFDKNEKAGGTLRYDISDNKLPKSALDAEIDIIKKHGANFKQNTNITKELFELEISGKFDAIVIAMGNYSDSILDTFGFNSSKYGLEINRDTFEVNKDGIFACGNIIRSRRMAVTSVAQGKAAANSVHQYLNNIEPQKKKRLFNSKFGKLPN